MSGPSICVVGCGRIAAAHTKRLKGRADLWFLSRRQESAKELNRSAGGQGVFVRLDDVLSSERVDAVLITTPPEVHADQVIRSLEADKAVFVEKPLCTNHEELEQIEAAAGERPVMVGENYYYKPSISMMRSWIEADEIGEIERASIRKCFRQKSDGWKATHGALFEGGIHFVALINALMGPITSVVQAEFPGHEGQEAERHSKLTLKCGTAEVELEYSWASPSLTKGTFQHSTIEGTRGRIVFESNGIYARQYGRRPRVKFPLSDIMGAGAMIDDLLSCLEGGGSPISGLQRAREDLETVFRAYEIGSVRPI